MFKLSENANLNYMATICRITDVFPIENSDNLVRTVVNGFDIVVDKNTNVGDIVIYFPTESAICKEFLSINNLYDSFELNSNYADVVIELDKASHIANETEYKERMKEIRRMAGFFNKHGRVRAINLRGCPSLGFLAKPEQFVNLFPKADFDWENNVGVSFDTIEDTLIVKKYVPRIVERKQGAGKSNARKNRRAVQRFDRLVEGQFEFHYDTSMLNVNMWRFNPDSMVSITKKIHGTSAIFCNILVNKKSDFSKSFCKKRIKTALNLRYINLSNAQKKLLTERYVKTKTRPTITYGNVYSSRGVIKNRYINKGVSAGFYGTDVWGFINNIISPFLAEGMTVYGEIMGYVPGTDKFIQKGHDYGCAVGECKFMPYRITMADELGNKTELDVDNVNEWTKFIMDNNPEVAKYLMPMVVYHFGRFGDLYPDVDPSDHWNENVLALMKLDKRFDMEEDEPLCTLYNDDIKRAETNLATLKEAKASKKVIKDAEKTLAELKKKKAPAEGIVVRFIGDSEAKAFKLKTERHYGRETEALDAGEVDMETLESDAE